MKLRFTKRFGKIRSKLEADKQQAVFEALARFIADPRSPGLHFEKLGGHKGVHTIRINGGDRIFLRATEDADTFIPFDVGPHDLYTRVR